MNLVYADADGNIGYQMVGRVPMRARGEGLVPSPGWSGQYEWQRHVPFDELPRAFNPPDGLWANANHNVAKNSTYFFTREFIDPVALPAAFDRCSRARTRHSAVDFGALQADEVSLPARRIAELLVDAPAHRRGRVEGRALDELRGWDGRVSADSAAASIYEVFRNELVRARHGEALGDLLPACSASGPHPLLGRGQLALLPADPARARVSRRLARRSRDRGARSTRTVAWLARRSGRRAAPGSGAACTSCDSNTRCRYASRWAWCSTCQRFPWSGDLETVRAGGSWPAQFDALGPISAYRFIADCGDWDNSLSCIPGGQSGHRGSPHYADQVDTWRRVAYHPLAFSRPAIAPRRAPHALQRCSP